MAEHISGLNLSFMNLSNLEQQIHLNRNSGCFLNNNMIFKPMGKWKVGFFHVCTFQLSSVINEMFSQKVHSSISAMATF